MKKLVFVLLMVPSLALADGVYTRTRTAVAASSASSGTTTSPGGSSGQLQYNNAGSFGGISSSSVDTTGNVTFAGVSVTGVLSATTVRTIAGTNSAPAFSFSNDTNTGMYSTGSDNLAFATGGSNRLNIGTSFESHTLNAFFGGTSITPSTTLHISGTTILGICNASITCGASQRGATCFSTAQNRLASCDGANSWIPYVSTTLVSASAL